MGKSKNHFTLMLNDPQERQLFFLFFLTPKLIASYSGTSCFFLNFIYSLKFLWPRNHRHVTSSAGRTDGHSQQSLLSPQPGLLFPAYSIFLSDGIKVWLPALLPMCSICSAHSSYLAHSAMSLVPNIGDL